MVYNPNIPNAGDLLSVSQGQLKTNFTAANTSFSRNHIPFSTATNNGKHTFIEMPIRAGIPAPAPGLILGEGTVYTKNTTTFTATTEATTYYTPDNTGNEYQLTRTISSKFGSFSTATGWTFLPGGLLLQWGQVAAPGSSGQVIFPVAFTTAAFSIQLTVQSTATTFALIDNTTPPTLTTFNYKTALAGVVSLHWIAIGK